MSSAMDIKPGDIDDPCHCGANDWKRSKDADSNLVWYYQCKACGYVDDCE